MSEVISVDKLKKVFHGKPALDEIDFTINKGEIFGFLGPSGAGKTTTINILTGQLKADSGTVLILGKNSQKLVATDFFDIGIMSDTVGFYDKMTLYKNLEFFAKFHKQSVTRVDDLLKRLDLFNDKDKKAEKLSTGMKQRMLLIRAVLHQPKVLFLDEPTSGLDPNLSQKVHQLLLELKQSGTTIFLTTHDMTEATKLCDKIALLHQGKIVEYGAPQAIIDKYSDENVMIVRYHSGQTITVPKEETYKYLGIEVASIHSKESSLESIFIELTGESLNGN